MVEALLARAEERKVAAHPIERGGRFIDCGIEVRGGLSAGLELARVCLADLADVTIVPGTLGGRSCPLVQVVTDHPVAACLASQYAGWAISEEKYFAMGSGPMRAAAWTRGDLREDRLSRGGRVGRRRARSAEIADARSGRQDRRSLPSRPLRRDLARRAHGEPGGRAPDRRPVGRDRLAQADASSGSTSPGSSSAHGHGPVAAGRRERPGRDRPDERRHPLRRPRRALGHR